MRNETTVNLSTITLLTSSTFK